MKHNNKKHISLFLCIILVVAIACCTTGCGKTEDTPAPTPAISASGVYEDLSTIGEGKLHFDLIIVDLEGNETLLSINTDKETLGEALLEHGIISGEPGEFGLFVKTVNGITADYNVDKTYWALYIEGEYSPTGVDSTKLEADITYSLEVSK